MEPDGKRTIRLYHGSPERDFTPTFGLGRDQHDYGKGFYLTEFPDLAREWAVAASPGSDGWLHAYDMDMEGLRLLDFTTSRSLLRSNVACPLAFLPVSTERNEQGDREKVKVELP